MFHSITGNVKSIEIGGHIIAYVDVLIQYRDLASVGSE